ncbi:DUF523 domain-containing protein [Nakamurella silvestris]|nr:DUF523 domain-containing protein [Nakamurella silvestris]
MTGPAKILISACLLGHRVRYDGRASQVPEGSREIMSRWRTEGRLVVVCPEVAAGFGTPRSPAEIVGGPGRTVLAGSAAVVEAGGADVTEQFRRGAEIALRLVESQGVRVALLKEKSPSCGSGRIYDGSFGGVTLTGAGVTTALLREHGVTVFNEDQAAEADLLLRGLDPASV